MADLLTRMWAIKRYFTFPPDLTSAAALPGETQKHKIASFNYKSSAVAEMGDRGHNRHGRKEGGGGGCAPFADSRNHV